ncbi:MAG: TIR domain-containing protein [Pseudomonas sp.]
MARRIFISYQHRDQLKAKGFNLMRYNEHLDLEFVGRHLLDPVKSEDPAYVSSKIRERLKGTSVTVVLIGDVTAQSVWVGREIRWSLDKKPPNGLLGIRLSPDSPVPDELMECGAEILNWYEPEDVHEFQAAIERAAAGASSALAMPINSASTCAR